jgi:lipid-binding SYLF domain-containing protein
MKARTLTAALALFLPLATAHADNPARNRRNDSEARESLRKSTEVYRSVIQNAKQKVPQSVRNEAKCVAIFPDPVTVSLGIGGVHSDGVAYCKTSGGQWENPMFLNMTGGSIGLQAGIKTADAVLYLTGDKAVNDLKNGKFRVGGELSAVAGSFDETFRPAAAQVVAYSHAQGLFAGASIDGVEVSRDRDQEMAFYGTENPSLTVKLPAEEENLVRSLRESIQLNVG